MSINIKYALKHKIKSIKHHITNGNSEEDPPEKELKDRIKHIENNKHTEDCITAYHVVVPIESEIKRLIKSSKENGHYMFKFNY